MLLLNVIHDVFIPFGPVGAVRAGELWLDPALVALMSFQVTLVIINFPAFATDELQCNWKIKTKKKKC
jgi:hypothetical protein